MFAASKVPYPTSTPSCCGFRRPLRSIDVPPCGAPLPDAPVGMSRRAVRARPGAIQIHERALRAATRASVPAGDKILVFIGYAVARADRGRGGGVFLAVTGLAPGRGISRP